MNTTARTFQDFITSNMLDADGLCRSFLDCQTLEPWTNDQLAKHDLSCFFQNAPDMAACLAYENALMSTSEWATSQLMRHNATGEVAALDAARHGIHAILKVAEQGRHYMPGYLPKPFGGIPRCRDSHEISPDQYTKAIMALYTWRSVADKHEAEEIDRFFVEAADFFVARQFRHAYRHRTIVTADSYRHSLGLFVPICVLATNITGKAMYREQLPLFDRAIDDSFEDTSLAGFNQAALLVEGFELALLEGHEDSRLKPLIESFWTRSAANVDEQGKGYAGPEADQYTSQSTRLASLATTVERHHPQLRPRELAKRILSAHNDVQQMRHCTPEDAATLPNSHQWLGHSICDTSISSWLLAYWRMQAITEPE